MKANRAALLQEMRAPFREQALKNAEMYGEFCAEKTSDDIEKLTNILWLKSVTEGGELSQRYYHSPLWKRISQEVLLRDKHQCVACGRDAETVHHLSYRYEVMVGLDDSKLVSLCHPCHDYIHFQNGRKLPMAKWSRRLKVLQKSFAKKRKKQKFVIPA